MVNKHTVLLKLDLTKNLIVFNQKYINEKSKNSKHFYTQLLN